MLTRFDDYCIHQTAEPIAKPGPTDRNFYDRYWFNGFDRNGAFIFEAGFGIYPNRFVMDGHFSIVVDGKQFCFHGSRRAPLDRTDTVIGPLVIEVLVPMKSIRILLNDNDTGISCDLVFTGRSYATQEPRNFMAEGVHTIMDTTRFTQFGRWQGHVVVHGKRVDVNPDRVYGTRDKSWGVRPIGEPQGGAPGLLNNEPGVYWVWSPLHFEDRLIHFATFEDRDGNSTQLEACELPVYASVDDVPVGCEPGRIVMMEARHKIHWRPGTREAQGATLQIRPPRGELETITMKPLTRFYMLGIGYQHPTWGHAFWKGDEVTGYEEWSLEGMDVMDYKHIHVHHVVEARWGDKVGVGTLETVCFGRHDPSGFKDLLDGAPGE